jgi:hypothetical protein
MIDSQYQHEKYSSSSINALLEIIRLLGTMMTTNPDDGFSSMAASNYQHNNPTVNEDLLEEIIVRLGQISPGGGGGGAFIAQKPNLTSVDDTGIANNELVIFDLSNKKLKTSDVVISTDDEFIANSDTKVPTERAIGVYIRELIASMTSAVTLLDGNGGSTYTNAPNSEQNWSGSDRNKFHIDTRGRTLIRLTTTVIVHSNSVNSPKIYLMWSTDGVSWSKVGAGSTGEISLSSVGLKETDWLEMEAGQIGDVYFKLVSNGGDGANDPSIGTTIVHFR